MISLSTSYIDLCPQLNPLPLFLMNIFSQTNIYHDYSHGTSKRAFKQIFITIHVHIYEYGFSTSYKLICCFHTRTISFRIII